jgi:hypothetical protein
MRIFTFLFLAGCTIADTNAHAPVAANYIGSSWSAELFPDGTSRVLHFSDGTTADFLVNGTDTDEGNGFTYITADSVAGDATTTAATAVELAGSFFTIDYADVKAPVVMVSGACPVSAWSGTIVPLTGGMPDAFAYDPAAGHCAEGRDSYVTGEQLWLSDGLALVQSTTGLALAIASPAADASGSWVGTYYDGTHSQAVSVDAFVMTGLSGQSLGGVPGECERGTSVMACTDGVRSLVVGAN